MNEIQADFCKKWKRCKEEGRIGEYDGIRIITSSTDKAALFLEKLLGESDGKIPIAYNDEIHKGYLGSDAITWSLIFSYEREEDNLSHDQTWVVINETEEADESKSVFSFSEDSGFDWETTAEDLFRKTIELIRGTQGSLEFRNLTFWKNRRDTVRKKLIPIYTSLAAGIAAVPIPFSDAMLLIPCQTAMGLHILKSYELESLEAPVSGLISSTVISQLGRMTAANLIKLIPVVGSISGTVINSSVASSFTWLLGMAISEISFSFKKAKVEGKEPDLEEFFSQLNLRNIMQGIDPRDYDEIF